MTSSGQRGSPCRTGGAVTPSTRPASTRRRSTRHCGKPRPNTRVRMTILAEEAARRKYHRPPRQRHRHQPVRQHQAHRPRRKQQPRKKPQHRLNLQNLQNLQTLLNLPAPQDETIKRVPITRLAPRRRASSRKLACRSGHPSSRSQAWARAPRDGAVPRESRRDASRARGCRVVGLRLCICRPRCGRPPRTSGRGDGSRRLVRAVCCGSHRPTFGNRSGRAGRGISSFSPSTRVVRWRRGSA